jgi:hypothetical protein
MKWYRKKCNYCDCVFACHGECGDLIRAKRKHACLCGACIQDREKEIGRFVAVGSSRCRSRMNFGIMVPEKVEFT